jgi:hypothetical protein
MMFFTKPNFSPIILPDDAALDKPDQPTAGVGEVFRTQEEAVDKSRQWFSFEENRKDVFREHRKKIKDLTGEDMPFGEDSSGLISSMKFQVTPEKEVDLYKDWHQYQRDGGTLGFKSFYWSRYEQGYRERLQYLADKYPQHRDAILPPEMSFESQARQMGADAEKQAEEAWARSKGVAPYLAWLGAEVKGTFKDPLMVGSLPLQSMVWAGRSAAGMKGIVESFLKSGAVNAGVEVGMAPLRQGARKELGLDYGAGQAAVDIGAAFALGGGLDAAIRGTSRAGRWAFGYEPVLDEAGKVMAYRKKLADGRTVDVAPTVHEKAEAGDAAAIRQLAEKEGLNDPLAIQALDALEADQRLAQKPSSKIHDVEHDAALAQATRHIDTPELEPVPVVREVSTTQLREITDMQADARVELKRLEADIEARLRDEASVDTARADAKARDEVLRLRTEAEKARADLETQIAARELEILRLRDGLMSKELQDLQDTGQFREDYIEAVIDHVPAMEMQARALQDLAKRAPGTPAEVRHVLSELLQSPDYRAPTVDIGPTPQSRGLKDKALDDPYGPDAKAQVDALMADQAQELGLAPVQRGKGKGKQAGTAAKSPEIDANSPARQPTARELTPDPIERAANVARAVDEAVAEAVQDAAIYRDPVTGDIMSEGEVVDLIGLWRYVKEEKRPKRPQGLQAFIMDTGRLKDQGGEITAMLGGKNRQLISEKGSTLDDAALRAYEAGFFPERPSISEFLDALSRDINGEPVIRLQDAADLEAWRAFRDLETQLDQLGIAGLRDETAIRDHFRARAVEGNALAGRQDRVVEARPDDDIPFFRVTQDTQVTDPTQRLVDAATSEFNWMAGDAGVGFNVYANARALPERLRAAVELREAAGGRVAAFDDPQTNAVYVSLAALQDGEIARVAHEVTHALERLGILQSGDVALLAERAKLVGDDVLAFDRASYEADFRARGLSENQIAARVQSEEAAHLIEARRAGRDFGREINGIIDRVLQFFERLRNKLSGYGFQTADDVIEAVLSGEMAKRKIVRDAMVQEDITAFALRPTLDMSREARMARAQAMGFDTSTVWYHGSARTDRIADKSQFDPKRATSGPMAFFSDSPDIASNYARGKPDTSIVDEGNIPNYYTVDPKALGTGGRSPISVEQSWYFLTPEQKQVIVSRMRRVGYENIDEATGPWTLHPEGVEASLNGEHLMYLMRESRGNPLAALRKMWLEGGDLVGREDELAKIFELAGYPHQISQKTAPWYEAQGVVPVYLKMTKPLKTDDTATLRDVVVPYLEQKFRNDRSRKKEFGADDWDKNTRWTPKEWVAELKQNVADDKAGYVWTSIPDKVTAALRELGYDGILDMGNKGGGGTDHRVAIPFGPQQVRSVNARFDSAKADSPNLMFAFAGERAKTADLDKLAKAKTLEAEGADRTKIWKETGWFRGVDQKWRFEIDDSQARMANFYRDDTYPNILRAHVPKNRADYLPQALPLEDYINHAGLEQAYWPTREQAPSVIFDDLGNRVRGRYSRGSDLITMDSGSFLAKDEGKSTVLHELQHRIQYDEGFPTGGNEKSGVAAYNEISARITRLIDEAGGNLRNASPDIRQQVEALKAEQKALPFDPYEYYRRLAGEVEARTVQKRMNMTPEERAKRPPWEDYDVSEKDQIVRMPEDQGPMFAMSQDIETGQSMRRDLDALANWVPPYAKADGIAAIDDLAKKVDPTGKFFDRPTTWVVRSHIRGEFRNFRALLSSEGDTHSIEQIGPSRYLLRSPSGSSSYNSLESVEKALSDVRSTAAGQRMALRHAARQMVDYAIDRNPQRKKQTVYRFVAHPTYDALKAGDTFTDPAFMSTTRMVVETAKLEQGHSDTVLRIKHWSGFDIEASPFIADTSLNRGELEVLIPAGQQFVVTKVEMNKNGVRIIDLDEVSDQQPMFAIGNGTQYVARDLDSLGYYSKALEAARGLKQAKGTPEQMLAQLKKAGVKDAEIAATRLGEAMSGKSSITRDEIIKHLEENRVGLKEVVREAKNAKPDRLRNYIAEEFGNPSPGYRIEETKWSQFSLDPSNPTYRETVLHLPEGQPDPVQKAAYDAASQRYKNALAKQETIDRRKPNLTPDEQAIIDEVKAAQVVLQNTSAPIAAINFQSGHFSEPNIIGHMMTSLTRHEGKPVFLIDQIQSDWGQKLRDGGVRDEAKIAELKAKLTAAKAKFFDDVRKAFPGEDPMYIPEPKLNNAGISSSDWDRLQAELRTAEASSPGNPLVNTTDQWTTTTLRRAIRQAIEADADYIAIPHGDTVLSYNPGDTNGMRGFYGSRATEGIVPKNLRKLLQSIDKEAQPQKVETLTTPAGERGYKPGADSEFEPNETGFTLFPLTPTVKDKVRAEGMPMFAMARQEASEPRPQQLDPETLIEQLANLAEPVRQALRAADQTKVARQFNFLTDETGLVSSMTEDASLRILRNDEGIISGVEYRGVPYQIGRDEIGNITGLLTAAQKEALDQQNAVTQTVADLIATNTGLAPERAKLIADEAMGIVTQNLADPDAIRTGLADLVQRTIDEIQGPMFAMTDDRGRMKPGAEMRKRELAADLAEIELRFQNSQGDERVKLQQQRAALLGAKALEERIDVVNSFVDAKGRHDPAKALLFIQEANPYQTAGKDLVTLRNVIEKTAWEKLSEVLWNFRKGAVTGDLRRRSASMQTDMADMIRAAAGEKVENPAAKVFADAWLGVAEMLRQRFNAAGGDIPKLQGWFAPQFHDAEALLKVGRDTWISYLMQPGVLDRARMVDNLSGAPLTDDQLRQALRNVYEAVTTAGQAKLDPGEVAPGRGALYKQHAEHRFIHFKNADAYLAYNKLYGGGDVYAAMIGHVHRMARDIAAMEILGPNPHLTWTRLKAYVQNQVMTDPSLRVPTLVSDLGERVQDFSAATNGAGTLDPLMANIDATTTRLEALRNADRNRIKKRHTTEIAKLETELADAASQIEDAMTALTTEPRHHTLAGEVQTLLNDLTSIQGYGIKPAWSSISPRDPQSRTNHLIKRADAMWAMYMGTSGVPVYKEFAAFMSGARNWISSSALAFAPMSSITDQTTQMAARLMSSVPVTKQLGSFVKAFGKQDRQLALSTSLGLDTVRNAFAEQAAMVDRMNAQGWTSYIADRTHALSFLSPMTSAQKLAYGLDFQRHMATLMDMGYQRLGPATRRMFERHDITPADWDLIRSATPEPDNSGTPMLTRAAIEDAVGIDLAEKYLMMLYREGSGSTLEASARGRTFYIGETQPGTLQGEVWRSIAMLKSFPTTFTMNVIGRIYYEIMAGRGFAAQTVGYAAAIFIGGTLLGGVAKQLKAIGQGRDPQDMTTPKFWAQAWMQSGGVGILGDFIGSSVSRTGVGQIETLAGPVASNLFNPIIGLTAGNLWQYGQDQKTNLGRESVNALRRNTPGAFVPWYLRLAYERQILDALQEQVDPEAYRDFARKRAYWRRTANQDFYWPPGASTPQTPVNFDRAVGR